MNHDARVVAKPPVELSGSDVDGMHPGGARLQQAIGEAAGGGAEIRNNEPVYIDAEVPQRCFEFESSAAHIAQPWRWFRVANQPRRVVRVCSPSGR